MKNNFYFLFLAVLVINGCQPKTKDVSVDATAEKDSITKNLEMMYSAFTAKDAKTFLSFMTEDCLSCCTDPNELWDRATYSSNINKIFADTSFYAPTFKIDKREIRFSKDGNSAIAIEQYYIPGWTTKIPIRNVTHHVKIENKWICDFTSMGFIPENKDLVRIFNSVKE